MLKGSVEERDGADVVSLRGPGDCLRQPRAGAGRRLERFVAREETLCHLLPRDVTLRLINQNPRFAAFFYLDISRKLDAAAGEAEERASAPMMHARVRELPLRPPNSSTPATRSSGGARG